MCCNVLVDEERFISIIDSAIKAKDVPSFPQWKNQVKDIKGRNKRKAAAKSEAKEAEELAKELGVHDKLFGNSKSEGDGEPGRKPSKGKGKKGKVNEDGVDEDALQALIQCRNSKNNTMNSLIEKLEAKYRDEGAEGETRRKNGKKADVAPGKKRPSKTAEEPTEEEFEALQKKMSGGNKEEEAPASRRSKKSKKA